MLYDTAMVEESRSVRAFRVAKLSGGQLACPVVAELARWVLERGDDSDLDEALALLEGGDASSPVDPVGRARRLRVLVDLVYGEGGDRGYRAMMALSSPGGKFGQADAMFHSRRAMAEVNDREKVLTALAKVLGVEREVRRATDSVEVPWE